MNTTKYYSAAALLLAVGAASAPAQAQVWNKTGNPGNLPATAQVTQGTGPLQLITGALTYTTAGTDSDGNPITISNPDLFEIRIDGSSLFSASASAVGLDSMPADTELFLFNAAGKGVYYNDDATFFTRSSLINPTSSPAAGLYYVGICTHGAVPRTGTTAAADMFLNTEDQDPVTGTVSTTGLEGPTAAGAAGALTNWYLSEGDVSTGSYTISLTGATYAAAPAAVPEASTAVSFGLPVLMGLGFLAVQARRRTKRSSAPSA